MFIIFSPFFAIRDKVLFLPIIPYRSFSFYGAHYNRGALIALKQHRNQHHQLWGLRRHRRAPRWLGTHITIGQHLREGPQRCGEASPTCHGARAWGGPATPPHIADHAQISEAVWELISRQLTTKIEYDHETKRYPDCHRFDADA